MSLSGIVKAVDEIWLERCGNEDGGCYEAVMVYSTLEGSPKGVDS